VAKSDLTRNILLVCVCAIAFAFVESSVVVYLRALYYPAGFQFPLHEMSAQHLTIETIREIATIIILITVALLTGTSRWQKFAFFLIAFGVWDVFYYVWLKLLLDWPTSLMDWDILFLVPLPWIGPVIAPLAVSVIFVAWGIVILLNHIRTPSFTPSNLSWIAAILGTGLILLTFLRDVNATLHFQMPSPFSYGLFFGGIALYLLSLIRESRGLFNHTSR